MVTVRLLIPLPFAPCPYQRVKLATNRLDQLSCLEQIRLRSHYCEPPDRLENFYIPFPRIWASTVEGTVGHLGARGPFPPTSTSRRTLVPAIQTLLVIVPETGLVSRLGN